jgi:TonB family protein
MLRPDFSVARQAELPPPTEPLCDSQFRDLAAACDAIAADPHTLDPRVSDLLVEICSPTGASGAALALEEENGFFCRGSVGATAPDLGLQIDIRHGLTAECLRSGMPQVCDNAERDPRVGREACRRLGIRSIVVVPLLLNACPRGMLAVYSPLIRAFGSADLQHLDLLARKITNLLIVPRATPVAHEEEMHQAEAHREQVAQPKALAEVVTMPMVEESVPAAVVLTETPENTSENASDTLVAVPSELPEPVEPAAPTETPSLLPAAGGHEQRPWTNRLLSLTVVAAAMLLGWMISASYFRPVRQTQPTAAPEANATPAPIRAVPAQSLPAQPVHAAPPPLVSASQSAHTERAPAPGELVVYEKNHVVFRLHSRPPNTVSSARSALPPSPTVAVPANELSVEKSPSQANASRPSPAKVTGGEVLYRVSPVAPPEAARLGLRGDVVLHVTIAKDGTVGAIRAVNGDSRLVPSAIDAVRQWRYQPFLQDGTPTEVQGKITIHFGVAQQDTQSPSPATPPSTPK